MSKNNISLFMKRQLINNWISHHKSTLIEIKKNLDMKQPKRNENKNRRKKLKKRENNKKKPNRKESSNKNKAKENEKIRN